MGKGMGPETTMGWVTESTYGTDPGSGYVYFPFTSESVKGTNPTANSGAITKSRQIQYQNAQVKEVGGSITVEADAYHSVKPLLWWNGQVSSSAHIPADSADLSAAASSGGSLTDATTYYYAVCPIVRTGSSSPTYEYFFGAPVRDSALTASPNLTIDLAWSTVDTDELGSEYTLSGWGVFRGSASGSEELLTVITNPATLTYSDTGSGSVTSGADVPPDIYRHSYTPETPVPGTHPLGSFTLYKCVDQADTVSNDAGEKYTGLRVGSLGVNISDPNNPVELTFDLMGQDFSLAANPSSPSITNIKPLMTWQCLLRLDGSEVTLFEGGSITASNNLTSVPWLAGRRTNRDYYPGVRDISGTFNFGAENHTQFIRAKNGTAFGAEIVCDGYEISPRTTAITATLDSATRTINNMPYRMLIHIPECYYQEAGAPIGGLDRLVEQLPFKCNYNTTYGYDMRIYVVNTTSTVS